ncbi:MAG: hypothetical protein WCQ41_09060 [Bacillota bacterium]
MICPVCKDEVEEDLDECPKCGIQINDYQTKDETDELDYQEERKYWETNESSFSFILIGIGVVAIILSVIGAYLLASAYPIIGASADFLKYGVGEATEKTFNTSMFIAVIVGGSLQGLLFIALGKILQKIEYTNLKIMRLLANK